jgi:DNA-binding SARP family transcriptional activator
MEIGRLLGVLASSPGSLHLRLLGPIEVEAAGRRREIGPPRQRGVLAVLAAQAGHPVMLESLVDRVWGDAPPARVQHAVYVYVSRLRTLFAGLGVGVGTSGEQVIRLSRSSGGYLLDIDPDVVDVHRFRRLVAHPRDGRQPDRARAEFLSDGLRLWRGTPLTPMPGEWATVVRHAWQQQRLDAAIEWAGIELRLGDPAMTTKTLTDLLVEHPLHEPAVALLMRALHALGRPGEALACYDRLRKGLAEQLGVDPSRELRDLHGAMLRGDLQPPIPARIVAEAAAARPVPAQLPANVPGFTGRERELSELTDRLAAGEITIAAIAGIPGVGKTALAVRFAHQVRDRFPDGQLYLNLRGYDHEQQLPVSDALAAFLRALGVPGAEIPTDPQERAAHYRTLLDGRRVLVLLDNVSSADQVGPLLPGSPSCLVLVTSRDSMPGLVARHGAHRIDVGLLAVDESVQLLRRLVGSRVDAEPQAATVLAEQCGRLPLALRVAAELAATQPAQDLADLTIELGDQRRRLDLLDAGGDAHTGLRAVFTSSYRRLPEAAAGAFRLLGLHPGPDVDAYGAAAVFGTDLRTARDLLERLARVYLVHRLGPKRFAMHDLIRLYAAEAAARLDPAAARQAALTRLLDHYRYTAATAMDELTPGDRSRRPSVAEPSTPTPRFPDRASAQAWADTERENLLAGAAHAAAHGWPVHTVELSAILWRYLDVGGHYDDALVLHDRAIDAARQRGDHTGQATAAIGMVHFRRGAYPAAADFFQRALEAYAAAGDRREQTHLLVNLGNVRHLQGRFGEAAACYRQALDGSDPTDRLGMFRALNNLGNTLRARGNLAGAYEHQWRALTIAREIRDRDAEAHALDELGYVDLLVGDLDAAARHCRQAPGRLPGGRQPARDRPRDEQRGPDQPASRRSGGGVPRLRGGVGRLPPHGHPVRRGERSRLARRRGAAGRRPRVCRRTASHGAGSVSPRGRRGRRGQRAQQPRCGVTRRRPVARRVRHVLGRACADRTDRRPLRAGPRVRRPRPRRRAPRTGRPIPQPRRECPHRPGHSPR